MISFKSCFFVTFSLSANIAQKRPTRLNIFDGVDIKREMAASIRYMDRLSDAKEPLDAVFKEINEDKLAISPPSRPSSHRGITPTLSHQPPEADTLTTTISSRSPSVIFYNNISSANSRRRKKIVLIL